MERKIWPHLIKNETQTAVINIVNFRIFINLTFRMLFKIHFQKWSKVTQGLQYYFPENFRSNLKFYENKNLSVSSLHRIFESENLKFPFSRKIASGEEWNVKN